MIYLNRYLIFIALGTYIQACYPNYEITSTQMLIEEMMEKQEGEWFDDYTFIQKTIKYDRDGNVRGEEIWYEAIKYPDQFRIDYGDPSLGNSVIYRSDSAYTFKDSLLTDKRKEYQEFLLMEGGLYQLPSSIHVLARLIEFGYDIEKFHETEYQGKKTYVFGADSDDLKSKQMWIDAENLYIVRKLSPFREKYTLETRYDDFKKYGPAWIENKVSFYIDGNLVQDEYYSEVDITVDLDPKLFDPANAYEWHWYEKQQ